MGNPNLPAALADLTSGNDQKAEAAALALAELGLPALDALIGLTTATDPNIRWWACRALSLQRHPDAIRPLLDALDDPDADVQVCAMLALAQRGAPEAIPGLIEHLAAPGGYVARQAEEALRQIGEPAALALAHALATHPNPQVRGLAARALAHLQNNDVIATLYDALDDESSFVQFWAEEALQRRGYGQMLYKP